MQQYDRLKTPVPRQLLRISGSHPAVVVIHTSLFTIIIASVNLH